MRDELLLKNLTEIWGVAGYESEVRAFIRARVEAYADEMWEDAIGNLIVMKKGNRRVRVWVDRKTGALMQAEELADGRTLRRLWGTRIKKFGDRWMANTMEVETIGTRHRTKITVEELK